MEEPDNTESLTVDLSEVDVDDATAGDETKDEDSTLFVPEYDPREPVEIESSENTPKWLVYQVDTMRNEADELRDFLDIYDRFMEEDWDEVPSEVQGFLEHHGYDAQADGEPLEWLVESAANKAVELNEQEDLVSTVYLGEGYFGEASMPFGGIRSEIDPEEADKIDSELPYARGALHETEKAGATTEGGYTPPRPMPGLKPNHSIGQVYKQKLEEEAENVDWIVDRTANWD